MKKNILGFMLGFACIFSLMACDEQNKEENSNTTPTDVDPNNPGGNPSVEEKEFVTPEIIGEMDPSTVTAEKIHFNDSMKENGPFSLDAFPALGTPKMLVIPVNFEEANKTNDNLNNIKIAFEGTEEQTGWESVKTYYKKSSYNKLNIEFVYTDWFTPSLSASYYETYEDEQGGAAALVAKEALDYFDKDYDFSSFDYDEDGYIDNIWMVYNSPVNYKDDDTLWWAFQDKTLLDDTWDNVKSSRFGWAGIDFMDKTKEEHDYDTTNIIIDAHTFIHETGHIMGLEDYYDYDESIGPKNRGLFGADMMDWNIGDHSSFNKMSLGWIDPTVVEGNGKIELTLNPFTTSGEFLLLANHKITSIWDEYFLIEFYTNDGLNSNDEPIMSDEGVKAIGIRIIHVDAHICLDKDGNVIENGDEAYAACGFKYDNTGTTYPMIEMLRADYGSNMEEYLYPESLYTEDSNIFGNDVWSSFKLNDGSSLFFTLSVKKIENNKCTIELNIK